MNPSSTQSIIDTLSSVGVVAVIEVSSVDRAVALAQTLAKVGGPCLEITLRSAAAVDAIRAIVDAVPNAVVGAGTVMNPQDLDRVTEAGAQFAISPGATPALYAAASKDHCPWIPGVATASELMVGHAHGYALFKFFPAQAAGGMDLLKAWSGPFPTARFIPTGGVNETNASQYRALANVVAVGGSWMVPKAAIEDRDWAQIEALARASLQLTTQP